MYPHLIHGSFGLHMSDPPNGISIDSAIFVGITSVTNTDRLTATLCQDMHRNSPHLVQHAMLQIQAKNTFKQLNKIQCVFIKPSQ